MVSYRLMLNSFNNKVTIRDLLDYWIRWERLIIKFNSKRLRLKKEECLNWELMMIN